MMLYKQARGQKEPISDQKMSKKGKNLSKNPSFIPLKV